MDPAQLIALRDYARNLLGRIASSGWRPVFGWGGGVMLLNALHFALVGAPRAGITLDGSYYNFLLGALGLFIGAFVARTVDKHLERQAAPLVNQAAIS